MIDILPYVADLLESTGAQIELEYQDTTVTFPLIVLNQISNVGVTTDCIECFTRLSVQIDAYTLDKHDTVDLAGQIDEIMTANGFTRQNAIPLTEKPLERYSMTYSCNIDFSHSRIIS